MHSRYNAEIVAGALLPQETRIIAKLVLEGCGEDELKQKLTVENILQKRSPATAVRKYHLIRKRLDLVNEDLVHMIAEGNRPLMMQALLVAAIKHSNLLGDFLQRVIKEKWRIFETKIKPSDWENYLQECGQIDVSISELKETTRNKLGQVVRKCLVEAGYLESAAKPNIVPVMLLPKIKNYLIENEEEYVLSCMNIFI